MKYIVFCSTGPEFYAVAGRRNSNRIPHLNVDLRVDLLAARSLQTERRTLQLLRTARAAQLEENVRPSARPKILKL